MKILIATNSYPTHKNPTHHFYIKNICDGLKKEGHEVNVIYNRYFDFFKSDVGSGNLFSSVFKSLFILLGFIPTIVYRARKYDLLYSHAAVWPGFLMLAAQKIHNKKHVVYIHGSAIHYQEKWTFLYKMASYTLRRCSKVVTNSAYVQKNLLEKYNCQSTVISPGYNEDVFTYKKTKRNIDILFAGNATRQKGIDLFLECITNHKEFYERAKLNIHIYFSGGLKKEMMEYVRKQDIHHLITFGERLLENELAEAYYNSKIVVLPSRKESLGLVGIEAIACGAVLVGSDSGGIKEYLAHAINGFLFQDGNSEDLHQAIHQALKKYPEFENHQPAVAQSVKHYSLNSAMNQTIALFRTILTS